MTYIAIWASGIAPGVVLYRIVLYLRGALTPITFPAAFLAVVAQRLTTIGGLMRKVSFWCVASSLAVLSLAAACSPRASAPRAAAEVAEQLNQLAVPFVENTGQSDPRVAYYAPTFSGTVFVTGDGEVVYAVPAPGDRAQATLHQEPANGWTLTESFVDGHPTPVGAHTATTHLSVFTGNDPTRWQRDVASYADVTLGAVWPGISVTLAAHGKQVEKVFT